MHPYDAWWITTWKSERDMGSDAYQCLRHLEVYLDREPKDWPGGGGFLSGMLFYSGHTGLQAAYQLLHHVDTPYYIHCNCMHFIVSLASWSSLFRNNIDHELLLRLVNTEAETSSDQSEQMKLVRTLLCLPDVWQGDEVSLRKAVQRVCRATGVTYPGARSRKALLHAIESCQDVLRRRISTPPDDAE